MQLRTAAIARWLVPACLAAPAFAWTIYTFFDGVFDPLVIGLVAAFFVAQMVRALFEATDLLVRATRKFFASLRKRMAPWRAELVSYHLGMRRKFIALVLMNFLIWGIVIAALMLKEQQAVPIVASVAGLTATLGWTFSSYITARNTQRQNTITLLLNMRHSDVYSRHFNNAYFVAQSGKRDAYVHWAELDKQATWKSGAAPCAPTEDPQAAITVRSAYQSVIYVLNYFEFIAAGVRSSALDAGIVRATVSNHLRTYFSIFSAWVTAERQSSSRAYENLEWYCGKFPARAD